MNAQTHMFAKETLIDPFAHYRAMHEMGTAIQHLPEMNTYVVYSYDLCSEATGRTEEFSNDFTSVMGSTDPEIEAILAEGYDSPGTLLTVDAPIHTRNRKLVNLAFSMPRVNALEDGIRDKVNRLIDGFIDKGECDFVEAFSVGWGSGPQWSGLGDGEIAYSRASIECFLRNSIRTRPAVGFSTR